MSDVTDPAPDHVPDESSLLNTAEAIVQRLVKADKRRKWQVRVLAAVCALLMVVSVFTALGYFSNRDAAAGIKSGAVSSCASGNKARATNEYIWVSFINLLLKGNTNAEAQKEGKAFIALVQNNEKPQDCSKIYSAQASAAFSPKP